MKLCDWCRIFPPEPDCKSCGELNKNFSKAPEVCLYCDGEGNSTAGGRCGFCENGKPLDTQEDWDKSWGKVFEWIEQLKEGNKNA